MIPTFIGMALLLVALVLFATRSTLAMFALLIGCGLMGGSAAVILVSLGGSSVPPVQFVLPFLVARILLAGRERLAEIGEALKSMAALVAYIGYGLIAAVVCPRIFARQMDVVPLRAHSTGYLFEVAPLVPTSQNITTSIYLVGTLLVALCAFVVCRRPGGATTLVRTAVVIAWIHVFLGVSDMLFGGTAYGQLLGIFRNGTYAQLDQSYGDFVRMKGIFPEASGYAAFAFIWFIFLFECWFRGVEPRRTGPVALALAMVLVFSTSGTAYVGLGCYALIFALRSLLMPRSVRGHHLAVLALALLAGMTALSAAALFVPKFAAAFSDMISHMTVDKGSSSSGLQRLFWARKGIEAFWVSNGIGIGPGSFRSSSLATAILGSCGVFGAMTFMAHVLRALGPLRASTYLATSNVPATIGVAAAWAMLGGLIPAFVASPSCDPGVLFGIMSGAAIGLRRGVAPRASLPQPGRPARAPRRARAGPPIVARAEMSRHRPTDVGEGFRELDPRIEYYPKYGPRQNFGDYLPEIFSKRLLTYPRIDADVFRLVGSVIDEQRVRRNLRKVNGTTTGVVAFWCCGARNPQPIRAAILAHCRFFGVRGPLTRDLLGLPAETVLGDPGLLAPLFHPPRLQHRLSGRTVCMPHIHDPKSSEDLLRRSGADFVLRPEIDASEAALLDLLDQIASADFVLTGSLHGAIIACAYGRPFAFWDNGHVDLPFKWQDFAASVRIPADFVGTIGEGRNAYARFGAGIVMPALAPILDVCPFQVRPAMLARALAHDGHAESAALLTAAAALDSLASHQPGEVHRLQAESIANRRQRGRLSGKLIGGPRLLLQRIRAELQHRSRVARARDLLTLRR